MSVCPGCGRCRQCGYPAPVYPVYPYVQPSWPQPWLRPSSPIWISPVTCSGTPGNVTITNSTTTGTSL